MQNYKVQPGHTLVLVGGPYREGDVLPGWFADRDGGLAARLELGCLAATADPATVSPVVPAKTAADPAPELRAEAHRLADENKELASSNKELLGRCEGLGLQVRRLEAALGRAGSDIEHYRAACEEHQAARDRLEAELAELKALDAATAPTTPE